jgi:hypothetical protein
MKSEIIATPTLPATSGPLRRFLHLRSARSHVKTKETTELCIHLQTAGNIWLLMVPSVGVEILPPLILHPSRVVWMSARQLLAVKTSPMVTPPPDRTIKLKSDRPIQSQALKFIATNAPFRESLSPLAQSLLLPSGLTRGTINVYGNTYAGAYKGINAFAQ